VLEESINSFIPPQSLEEQWDVPGLEKALETEFGITMPVQRWLDEDDELHEEPLRARIGEIVEQAYEAKEQLVGSEVMRRFEKEVMLSILDSTWKEHLAAMDYLRQSIGLRGYAQKNPKQEYKREAFEMFGAMLDQVKHDTITILARVRVQSEADIQRMEAQRRAAQTMEFRHAEASALAQAQAQAQAMPAEARQAAAAGGGGMAAAPRPDAQPQAPFVRGERKVGRNEPCPCGSGKKYKQCHGRLT